MIGALAVIEVGVIYFTNGTLHHKNDNDVLNSRGVSVALMG